MAIQRAHPVTSSSIVMNSGYSFPASQSSHMYPWERLDVAFSRGLHTTDEFQSEFAVLFLCVRLRSRASSSYQRRQAKYGKTSHALRPAVMG